jgi:hypothetical protein
MNFKSHILKAERNKKVLYKYLMKIIRSCPDWVTVVAFYSALHFVEAFLKKNHGLDFEHHEERHRTMSTLMREIFPVYYRLYDLSFSSRYRSVKDAPTYEEAQSAVEYDLTQVEEYVRARI